MLKQSKKGTNTTRKHKDTDVLYENHIDLKNRRVFFFGEVNEENCLLAIKNLMFLDDSEGPITFMINSPGGELDSGWGLFDTIVSLKNEITGIVVGQASSMASIILQACDIRKMTKNSLILVHNAHWELSSPGPALKTWAKSNKEFEYRVLEIFKNRTKLSISKLKQLISVETIINSAESLAWGFVDGII